VGQAVENGDRFQPVARGWMPGYLAHRRIYETLLWAVLFVFQAFLNSVTATMEMRREHVAFAPWEPVVWEFSSCLTLLALVPVVLAIERRYPFQSDRWQASLGYHTLATVPFSVAHVAVMVFIRKVCYYLAAAHYDFGDTTREFFYEYLKDCRTYAMILATLYVYRYFLMRIQGEAKLMPPAEGAVPNAEGESRPERFLVRKLGKEFLIAAAEIEWLEASGNYVNLHVRGRAYPLRSTMAALEPRLDAKRFRRVHRSFIVNLDHISEIEPLESGDARLRLRDGALVPCSRRYKDALRSHAGGQ
jgi:DNA-binding LytR/AlgR family response regulator